MIKTLEKIFLFLLILLLPTQLGFHFWPNWSFVAGIRVDYLSPTVYLTDTLILALLLCSLFTSDWYRRKKTLLVIFGVIVFALINSFGAISPWASLLKWGKILELALFTLYLISTDREKLKTTIVKALPFSIIAFALIGFLQIIMQKTIGGPLYFLGERSFTSLTPGIALYSLFGKLLLRPYSTFPHPNVFGAYMFVASFVLAIFKKEKKPFDFLAIPIGFVAALLSGSLGVYVGMVAVFVLLLLGQRGRFLIRGLPVGAILLSFVFLFSIYAVSPGDFSEVLAKRISLAKASAEIVAKSPFLGVGFNNFVVGLPALAPADSSLWILQPVHNIFLLTFVETGIAGLLLLAYLLQKVLRKENFLSLTIVFVIITGLVDHYWLTIQQTQVLFALLVGFLW